MNIQKIAVIGPESTGKSLLSEALAARLHTVWVPEYARTYLENLNRTYIQNDLLTIAKGQIQQEDALLPKANKYLICDTDLYVLKVWSEYKYNACHNWILQQIAQRTYDTYILTYIDTVWEHDPLREHPQPSERAYFYSIYQDIVLNSGVKWIDARGSMSERIDLCLKAIHT